MAVDCPQAFSTGWHNAVHVQGRHVDSSELWEWMLEQPGFYFCKIIWEEPVKEIWMFTDPEVAFEFKMRFA
jgi:hypothetical protein